MKQKPKDYTLTQVAAKIGVGRDRLQDWVSRGYIPSKGEPSWRGDTRYFSEEDLHRAAIFWYLVKYGFKREKASDIVAKWDGNSPLMTICDEDWLVYLDVLAEEILKETVK